MPNSLTSTDQHRGWCIVDHVTQLRALETNRVYPLPDPTRSSDAVVGSDASSSLQLDDPTCRISRRHAYLAWDGARWTMRDLSSKNGLWIDGVRRKSVELTPGVELGIGGLTLLAESPQLLALHALLARLLGCSDDRRGEVDRALRGLRHAAQLRASLVLCGDGDLVRIANRLHDATLGAARPFVVCDGDDRAMHLLPRAGDGTLCVAARCPPDDVIDVIEALRTSGSLARLVVCAPTVRDASPIATLLGPTVWLELPPLSARLADLPRLIADLAHEAAAAIDQPITTITEADIARLSQLRLDGVTDLEDTVFRLVAIRTLGISGGASRLGITHGALSRWFRRRGLSA